VLVYKCGHFLSLFLFINLLTNRFPVMSISSATTKAPTSGPGDVTASSVTILPDDLAYLMNAFTIPEELRPCLNDEDVVQELRDLVGPADADPSDEVRNSIANFPRPPLINLLSTFPYSSHTMMPQTGK
jgi:hypothetical protein